MIEVYVVKKMKTYKNMICIKIEKYNKNLDKFFEIKHKTSPVKTKYEIIKKHIVISIV